MNAVNRVTRFGLMRHAETLWNLEKRIQGHSDSPLTERGEAQAARWGQALKKLSFERMLASDTGRARATADIVNAILKIPLTLDANLREQDWGDWSGKTRAQIKAKAPQMLARLEKDGWNFRPPGGEDRKSILNRSRKALTEAAGKWPGTRILVVTHEGVIKSVIYHLCGRKFLPSEPALIKRQHLHWLFWDQDGLRLEAVNAFRLG